MFQYISDFPSMHITRYPDGSAIVGLPGGGVVIVEAQTPYIVRPLPGKENGGGTSFFRIIPSPQGSVVNLFRKIKR